MLWCTVPIPVSNSGDNQLESKQGHVIRKKMINFLGGTKRMREMRNTYKILNRNPNEGEH
jgi:hypothetical protein